MSNEDIIKEIEKASKMVREAARDVNVALCHSRNVVENEDNEKAYNKGLEDAWKLADKINNMTMQEVIDVYGFITDRCSVFEEITPQEALAKLEAYEKSKEIKVGDVIESIYSGRLGVITNIKDNGYYVLFMDGMAGEIAHDDWKKTGKHIDITSVLEQLRGE